MKTDQAHSFAESSLRDSSKASLDVISHLALSVGRLLFQNNADTETVRKGVERFANAFGCEAHLLVTYETLLLTISHNGEFRTKTGNRIPSLNVNMSAVTDVIHLLDNIEKSHPSPTEVQAQLERIEHRSPIYHQWLVVVALGLTAASLSRLFGGDWPTFFVAWFAGSAGTWIRMELGRRRTNLFFIAFLTALASGVVAGVAVLMKLSALSTLCLVAPGMIIVPGVPLVNSIIDMMQNHMVMGLARLGFGSFFTMSIAFGLYAATALTGVPIPVSEPSHLASLPGDALFSALAALGYLILFNVPARLAWVGILCGVASHTSRTFFVSQGLDIVTGSLLGALAAGFIAQEFARSFRVPFSAFAFPGVVAMIPGSYAFRAVIGYVQIIQSGYASPLSLVAEVIALTATCLFMVLAIAIGLTIPLLLTSRNHQPQNGT